MSAWSQGPMFRTVKDYQMPAPSPDSVAGSEGRRVISRRSINDGFRRAAAVHWHRDEGPLATHSHRSASVGTVGKHLFFDNVLNRCRGFIRSPEIIAGNPCRNGSVYGNPAYEAFPCVHPSPIRVSVPLLLRPHVQDPGYLCPNNALTPSSSRSVYRPR